MVGTKLNSSMTAVINAISIVLALMVFILYSFATMFPEVEDCWEANSIKILASIFFLFEVVLQFITQKF